MKRLYLYLCVLSLGCAFALHSCSKDAALEPQPEGGFSIRNARTFFERFEGPIRFPGYEHATRSGSAPQFDSTIHPLWERARTFRFRGVEVVEVPLNIDRASIHRAGEPGADGAGKYNTVYRLLAVEHEGEILYSVASYTADSSYIDSLPGIMDDLSLQDMAGFSGRVLYNTVGGELMGGVVCREGKAVGVLEPAESPQQWPLTCPKIALQKVSVYKF